ncbi:RHS repeat-associated core domain-containing protein [Thiolapillus sp.]|uniref:RHS repeat-associated core domain-containing protein n=18 Tax=Thiolapillus sp. TaxID=2017437 RepID=UPI003AF85FA0
MNTRSLIAGATLAGIAGMAALNTAHVTTPRFGGQVAHGPVYIFGKRAYSYKLSRFLTPDPARSEYSSYLYAKDNPLKFHDKSGEIAVAIIAFFTALIGTSAISASLAGGAGGATAGAVTAATASATAAATATATATAAGVAAGEVAAVTGAAAATAGAAATGVATGASVAAETVATASAGWAVMATGVESATAGAEAVGLSGGAAVMGDTADAIAAEAVTVSATEDSVSMLSGTFATSSLVDIGAENTTSIAGEAVMAPASEASFETAMATAPEEYEMSLLAGTQEVAPLANAQIQAIGQSVPGFTTLNAAQATYQSELLETGIATTSFNSEAIAGTMTETEIQQSVETGVAYSADTTSPLSTAGTAGTGVTPAVPQTRAAIWLGRLKRFVRDSIIFMGIDESIEIPAHAANLK